MARILIVYYSRSGYTRRVARMLARRLGGDIDEIKIVQPVRGPLGYALSAIEALAEITPPVRPALKSPKGYDCIVVGTPVWFWSLSSPVRAWLANNRVPRARFAFFCTMGGSGSGRVFAAMAKVAKAKPIATLALTDEELDARDTAKLDAFVAAVKRGAPARAGRMRRTKRARAEPPVAA
jgi:flavodoxin